jgi:uncharacterized membrane protein YfcA
MAQEGRRIPEPPLVPILTVIGAFVLIPIVLLLLQVPKQVAGPIMILSAICATVYGGYWTMRIIHVDRANARHR